MYIWTKTLPLKSGKYIVETKSMCGNIRKLEATYRLNDNGNGSWSFTNQTYVRHLKQI